MAALNWKIMILKYPASVPDEQVGVVSFSLQMDASYGKKKTKKIF